MKCGENRYLNFGCQRSIKLFRECEFSTAVFPKSACADGNINMADTLQRKMLAPATLREKLTAWDAKTDPKASLGDTQKDSFMELTTHSGNRALPVEVG